MRHQFFISFFLVFALAICSHPDRVDAQSSFRVIGYYAGPAARIDSFEIEKLTHLIFCFGGLKDQAFHIRSAEDSLTIKKMVALKKRNPKLKVMLSLGGWGGCGPCSEVFSSEKGRKAFARSVNTLSRYFKVDGLDLDWEYPVISGYPGHVHQAADRRNFTALLQELRKANPLPFEISFAAGGFTSYIDSSIEWKEVLPYTSFINIMSYDLVHGYSTSSGHHTPLYSTPLQLESTDHAVQLLIQKGVPAEKLIIGAAFYGRFFQIDTGVKVDLYQPAHFSHSFSSHHAADTLSALNGFTVSWDDIAQAPYAIHQERRLLATYDDAESVKRKTRYAHEHQLGGIMFWQLMDDALQHGLLEVIDQHR